MGTKIFLGCLIITLILLPFVFAETPNDIFGNDTLVNGVLQGKEKLEGFNNESQRTEFLKQEWTYFLEKNAGGRLVLSMSNVLKKANPLIEKVIGVPYSLSWAFLFGFVIWLALIALLFSPAGEVFNNYWLGLLAATVIASIIGITGVIKKAVDLLAFAIQKWWIAAISLVVAVIVLLIFERVGRMIKKKIKEEKDSSEKEKQTKNKKIIDTDAKIAKKDIETYKEGAD